MQAPDALKPTVAGQFYPADPVELTSEIQKFLSLAEVEPSNRRVLAVLAPHAGYPFSGLVAGCSFRHVQNQNPDTVLFVALGHKGVDGASVFDGVRYETPLGNINIDQELNAELLKDGQPVQADPTPHFGEHSVEVNLPFVQTVFPRARVSSLLISQVDAVLCKTVGGRIARATEADSSKNVLLIVSSDLSHYPKYDVANLVDQAMLKTVQSLSPHNIRHDLDALKKNGGPNLHCVMCGGAAMLTTVEAACALGATEAKTLHYQNSGDSEWGDHDRVVGYGSLAIYWPDRSKTLEEFRLSEDEQKELLHLARLGVLAELTNKSIKPTTESASLKVNAGLFVTLKNRGELRGCLGRFAPVEEPLYQLAPYMAGQSAMNDHRFLSLLEEELLWTDIQISVLSPLRPIDDVNEIRIGRDGLQIEGTGPTGYQRSGTLLPQVASERNWSVEEFLEAVCAKAGMAPGSWNNPDAKLWAYSAHVFGDLDFQSPPFCVESQPL